MIGNISIAGDMNQLQTFVMLRNQFMTSYVTECKKRGISFIPNKTKIVVVNDTDSCGDEYIVGSILLPNSRAMFNLIEGDYNSFCQEYYNKLEYDVDVQEYIVVLLAGLVERGFDYIFYFDNNDPAIWTPIAKALFDYLGMKFGIVGYDVMSYCNNPNLFISPSIVPEKRELVQNTITKYKLSNRPESLFMQF